MIQLNKTSLYDEVNTLPLMSFRFELNYDVGKLERVIEDISVDRLYGRGYYTTYPVALLSQEGVKLIKDFDLNIEANKINDTDKVFFTKSSLFPRTSFNRYSDKARLVQTVKAATKFVIPNKIFNKSYLTNTTLYKFTSNICPNGVLINIDTSNTYNVLNACNVTALTKDESEIKKECNNNRWNIIPSNVWWDSISSQLDLKFKATSSQKWEVEAISMSILSGRTKKEKETLPFLLGGDIEIEDFINDTEVNKYIDTFKGEFDDSMYEYLYTTLSAHTSNPEVPMQLLCNMKIDNGNPRLDALFINLNRKAINNILGNRVMNTVDVKNFMNAHKLETLLDYYSTENIETKLRALNNATKKYNNPTDRRKLFDLTKEGLEELINKHYSLEAVNIKLNYEELKESD